MLIRYWRPLAGALAALAAVWAVRLYGATRYDEGVADERARQTADALEGARSRGDVEQSVGRLADGAAFDELRRDWSRD